MIACVTAFIAPLQLLGHVLSAILTSKRESSMIPFSLTINPTAYKNTGTDDTTNSRAKTTPVNDIRLWENGSREHVLDAVSVLDK